MGMNASCKCIDCGGRVLPWKVRCWLCSDMAARQRVLAFRLMLSCTGDKLIDTALRGYGKALAYEYRHEDRL